jgi:hypothetical protein
VASLKIILGTLSSIDSLSEMPLAAACELGVEQQVGEADDAVHGRAQLVADHGQERALGAVGLLGGFLGLLHFLLGLLARGDVGVVDRHAVAQLRARHAEPARRVPAGGIKLELGGLARLDHGAQLVEQAVLANLRVGGEEVAANQLVGVLLQQLLGGGIDVVKAQVAHLALVVAYGGKGNHAVDRVVEQARLLAAAFVELALHPLARGDVAESEQHAVLELGEHDLQPLVALRQLAAPLVRNRLARLHGVDHAGEGAVLLRVREKFHQRAEVPAVRRLRELDRGRVGQDALEIDGAADAVADGLVGADAVAAILERVVQDLVAADQVILRPVHLRQVTRQEELCLLAVDLDGGRRNVETKLAAVGMLVSPLMARGGGIAVVGRTTKANGRRLGLK